MANFFKKINHSKSSKTGSSLEAQSPPVSALPTPPAIKNRDTSNHKSTISPSSVLDVVDTTIIDRSENHKNQQNQTLDPTLNQRNVPMVKQLPDSPAFSTNTHSSVSTDQRNSHTLSTIATTPEVRTIPSNVQRKQHQQQQQQQQQQQPLLDLPQTPTYSSSDTPWSKKIFYNSPFPRFGHTLSSQTSNSGSLYMMGGLSGTEVYGDMWVIEQIRPSDIPQYANNQSMHSIDYPYIASPIENFQKIPSPRTGHASILIGNAFIIFGGDTAINEEQSLDNQLYFFNISSLKWTITSPKGPRPCGRYGTQISVLNLETQPGSWLSELYVFGGQFNDTYFNDFWKFDLTNFRNPGNQWVKINAKGDVPPPLTDHSMSSFNEMLYVFGGHSNMVINDKLYCYNSIRNEWSICKLSGPTYPPAMYGHSTAIHGSLLFIYGGKLANEDNSNNLYIIDLSNYNSWKLKSNLPLSPIARFGHSISINSTEEKLLIMGGDVFDEDYEGIADTSINLIDQTKFDHSSSVIYECDVTKISKFLEKPKSIPPSTAGKSPIVFPTFDQEHIRSSHSQSHINLTDSPELHKDQTAVSKSLFASSTPIKANQSILVVESTPDVENDTFNDDLTDDRTDRVLNPAEIAASTGNILQNKRLQPQVNMESIPSNETSILPIVNEAIYKTPEESAERVAKFQQIPDSLVTRKENNNVLNAPTFSTPLLQQSAPLPFSPAISEKDNLKLQKLLKMVGDVKSEMKSSVAIANAQISKLEVEKAELLKQLEDQKKSQIYSYNIGEIQGGDGTPLGERNMNLMQFIADELSTVPDLRNLVNSQNDQIQGLKNRLQTEELLNEKILKLEAINSALKTKVENLALEKSDDEIQHLSKLNQKLDVLTEKWSTNGPQVLPTEYESEIEELKKKHSETAAENDQLNEKLKEYEAIFLDSKKSLSNSYQALTLSQSESAKLRVQVSNLSKELDELKLKKRVYSNGSQRNFSIIRNESNHSIQQEPVVEDEENEENNVSLIDERYEIKIQDLEANVYIVSQERDQLRDELNNLKKELYNLQKK